MTQQEIESKAYQEGHKAWEDFIKEDNEGYLSPAWHGYYKNPYHESTPEHRLWRLGWNNNFNGI
jgi:hypothetical protein